MLSRSFMEFSWQFSLKYCCLSQNCSHIFRDKALCIRILNSGYHWKTQFVLFSFSKEVQKLENIFTLGNPRFWWLKHVFMKALKYLFTLPSPLRFDLRKIPVCETSLYRGTEVSFYITHPNKVALYHQP